MLVAANCGVIGQPTDSCLEVQINKQQLELYLSIVSNFKSVL